MTSKADLVKSLKESVGYCNAAIERLTDAQAAETVKFFGRDKARLSVLYMNIAHDNEHYGNLVTYLRIKGLVPPSSEPRQTSQLGRLYFDLAHGQMASLFLGVPEGQRLTGKPRDPQGTTCWGKDSAVFMEEVIAWLFNR